MPGSVNSLGVANGDVLILTFLFSFISWNTSIKRCFLMSTIGLPSGIVPEGEAGRMLDSLSYLSVFKITNRCLFSSNSDQFVFSNSISNP